MALTPRRTFLVNRPFQLRFSIFVCLWVVAISFVYPLIIQQLFEALMRYAEKDPGSAPLKQIQVAKEDLINLLFWSQVGFVTLAFMFSIFVSHRIAGPLYKLTEAMKKAKYSTLKEVIQFREKDYFKEIATAFNDMNVAIRSRNETAKTLIDQASALMHHDPMRAHDLLEKAKEVLN